MSASAVVHMATKNPPHNVNRIDRAIKALPPEYATMDGARLRRDIRSRRDKLPRAARSFYEHLAAEVDVHGTDAAEHVRVEWTLEGRVSKE